jgi:hypothetical protein
MANANPPTGTWPAAVAAGYLGVAIDPTPNLNYTVAGVVQPLPTPESQYKQIRAAQRAVVTAAVDGTTAVAAVPVLTAINPTTAVKGTADVLCTLTGSGFTPASRVRISTTDVGGVWVDANTMTIYLGISQVVTPTTWPLNVFTPAPGGGTSASINFTVT